MHHWLVLIALLLAGCAGTSPSAQGAPPRSGAQLANPASRHCAEQGGTLVIERNPTGDQYGVCVFTDNYQCEEWALLRGECRAVATHWAPPTTAFRSCENAASTNSLSSRAA